MARFETRERGRQTRHSFSFGSFYDADRISFGPLIALNDDLLGSGVGYDAHEHSDVVLVTWVVTGELAHEDDDGATTQLPGELAVTHAGTGITHSERAGGRATRFVQSWLRPGDGYLGFVLIQPHAHNPILSPGSSPISAAGRGLPRRNPPQTT